MPAAGRKPLDGPVRHRVKPVHDWTLVKDVPFDGERPSLPKHTLVAGKRLGLLAQTKEWWDVVSTMPHCAMWGPGDWMFAIGTVYVAEAVFRGDMTRAAELRTREKKLGLTGDDRRDLRIRYVNPDDWEDDQPAEKPATKKGTGGAKVTSMDARRRRLTSTADAS